MAILVCEECKQSFEAIVNKGRSRKFCSQKCYHAWNRVNGTGGGRFKPGIAVWNKGTKGVMKPNSGSFTKGMECATKLPIGSVTIRTDHDTGVQRAWVKVAENGDSYDWKLRAVVTWGLFNGEISNGMVVHHKDRNTLNDEISNLELQDRATHLMEHRSEHERKRSKAAGAAARKRHAKNRLLKLVRIIHKRLREPLGIGGLFDPTTTEEQS